MFHAIYPVSLLDALNAEEDVEAWEASGAAALSEHVIRMLMDGETGLPSMPQNLDAVLHNDLRNTAALRKIAQSEQDDLMNKAPIVPRRVSVSSRNGSRQVAELREPRMMQG